MNALRTATLDVRSFLVVRTVALASESGFSFRSSSLAPSTFEGLRAEYRSCTHSHLPLRVSSRFNDRTILGERANLAFRFWHDLTHVALDADFSHAGEVAVGQHQLAEIRAVGHPEQSLVWRIVFAETLGQNECFHRLGVFPNDQKRFTIDYLKHGLPAAIDLERRRCGTVQALNMSNVVRLGDVRSRPHGPGHPVGALEAAVSLEERSGCSGDAA